MSYITYISKRACSFIIRRSKDCSDQLIDHKVSFILNLIDKVNNEVKSLHPKPKHSLIFSTACAGFWLEYNRNMVLAELQTISKTLQLEPHIIHDTIMILDSFERNVRLSDSQTMICNVFRNQIIGCLGKPSPKLRRLTHRYLSSLCDK